MNAFLERGIPDFRCSESHSLRFPAHLHRHVELVLMLGGRAQAAVDGERYSISAGDVLISFPNQVHSYAPPEEGERSFVLIVEPDLLDDLGELFLTRQPKSPHLRGIVDEEMIGYARRLQSLKKAHTLLEQTERKALLLLLFGKVLSHCELVGVKSDRGSALKAVINYCTEHYDKDLTLSQLEKELHMSRYYISHLFAERMGLGFNEYVNSLRISHACRLLQGVEQSVTAVALLVGFSTQRTFNRAFLREMGMTPSAYRKIKKGEKS